MFSFISPLIVVAASQFVQLSSYEISVDVLKANLRRGAVQEPHRNYVSTFPPLGDPDLLDLFQCRLSGVSVAHYVDDVGPLDDKLPM